MKNSSIDFQVLKESVILTLVFVVLPVFIAFACMGCQGMARDMGGTVTIQLEPNEKLEEITWKDSDSLWYLTRPMREDEVAETHVFQESSEFHVIEGQVVIVERKE